MALAVRGEDWRAAVQWIKDQTSNDDAIFLEPDLIEPQRLNRAKSKQPTDAAPPLAEEVDSERLRSYLLYPVRGPYYVDRPVQLWQERKMSTRQATQLEPRQAATAPRQVLLIRRPAYQLKHLTRAGVEVIPFGNLSIVINPG